MEVETRFHPFSMRSHPPSIFFLMLLHLLLVFCLTPVIPKRGATDSTEVKTLLLRLRLETSGGMERTRAGRAVGSVCIFRNINRWMAQ